MSVIIKGMAKPNSCHECPFLYDASICDGSIPCPIIPVQHGRWIKVDKHTVKCSKCGNYLDKRGVNAGRGDALYCPNCGAKMEEGGEDNGEIH